MRDRAPFALLALVASFVPLVAHAQTRGLGVQLASGSGLTIGSGDGNVVTLRSPLFLDAAVRTWSDEEPRFSWGGSLRLEIEGRASVAVVPRAEAVRKLGPIEIRPSAGLPVFFAPFTMAGFEGAVTAWLPLGRRAGVFATVFVDAFFLGDDVPDGAAVLMLNGAIGAELDL